MAYIAGNYKLEYNNYVQDCIDVARNKRNVFLRTLSILQWINDIDASIIDTLALVVLSTFRIRVQTIISMLKANM
jgi:hypothetical protein